MPNLQTIIISTVTGLLYGGGWLIFIDGAIQSPDAFVWAHILPIFGIVISMFCINLISPNRVEESGPIKLWLFFWFVLDMLCIGSSVWITSVEYPADPNLNWPGVTIIFATILIFCSGILFFIGRKSDSSGLGEF